MTQNKCLSVPVSAGCVNKQLLLVTSLQYQLYKVIIQYVSVVLSLVHIYYVNAALNIGFSESFSLFVFI